MRAERPVAVAGEPAGGYSLQHRPRQNQHKRWNTLSRRLAAISQLHQQAGFDSPTRSWAVEQFLAGLRRELGIAPVRKKPVPVADLKLILEQIPDSLLGQRDRALLLLGFSGAFRR